MRNATPSVPQEFEGTVYDFPAEEIISGNMATLQVYDSGLGLTGDFSQTDNFFTQRMIEADERINNIIRKSR